MSDRHDTSIDDLFKQKLGNYAVPPPPATWQQISRVLPQPLPYYQRPNFVAAMVGLALVVGLGIGYYSYMPLQGLGKSATTASPNNNNNDAQALLQAPQPAVTAAATNQHNDSNSQQQPNNGKHANAWQALSDDAAPLSTTAPPTAHAATNSAIKHHNKGKTDEAISLHQPNKGGNAHPAQLSHQAATDPLNTAALYRSESTATPVADTDALWLSGESAANKPASVLPTIGSATDAKLPMPSADAAFSTSNKSARVKLPEAIVSRSAETVHTGAATAATQQYLPARHHHRPPTIRDKRGKILFPTGLTAGIYYNANNTWIFSPAALKGEQNLNQQLTFGRATALSVGYDFNDRFALSLDWVMNSNQGQVFDYVTHQHLHAKNDVRLTYTHFPLLAKYKFNSYLPLTKQATVLNCIAGVEYGWLKSAEINVPNRSLQNDILRTHSWGFVLGADYDIYLTDNYYITMGLRSSITTGADKNQVVLPTNQTTNNVLIGAKVGLNYRFVHK